MKNCLNTIRSEIELMGCLVHVSARQKFDGDVGASARTFNDAMVQDRQFGNSISDRMVY